MQIDRTLSDACDAIALSQPGLVEKHITLRGQTAAPDFPPAASVVREFVYGGCGLGRDAAAGPPWPRTWAGGGAGPGGGTEGAQFLTVEGPPIRRIALDGRAAGSAWEEADAAFCHLGGILPSPSARTRTEQARSVFERVEQTLAAADMDFSHVVRTWFYLDRILAWYGEFNDVRTAFFEQRGVFERLVPASTGIGAANPFGRSLVAAVLAVRPRGPSARVRAVRSPLQCEPTAYRRSFSRAVETALAGRRCLYVSGTASIAPDGETAHAGDLDGQINLTMRVVGALLESRGMSWGDATRVVVYLKATETRDRFADWCRARALPRLPVVFCQADICRDDLLVEVELDAVRPDPTD